MLCEFTLDGGKVFDNFDSKGTQKFGKVKFNFRKEGNGEHRQHHEE